MESSLDKNCFGGVVGWQLGCNGFLHFLIYFLAVLGFRCCVGFSLIVLSKDCSLVVMRRLLIAVASLIVEHRLPGARALVVAARGLYSTGSIVVAHRLSWSEACGSESLLGQGLNPHLLHWQVDSSPLSHQGSLHLKFNSGATLPHQFILASLTWIPFLSV